MDPSLTDPESQMLYAGVTFGGLTLIVPLIGAALSTWPMGLVYGIALYGVLWFVVLPLRVDVRRL